MGIIKKITAVKRRALCPKCFSVIQWDNATFERYDSETDSYYIVCPAELNDSNCGQKIPINKINPEDYLDNDIVFEPVEGGETISIDSEDVNFNNATAGLKANNVKQAIEELNSNTNSLNGLKIHYDNNISELDATNVQVAIDKLKNNIDTINQKKIQADSITYNNIDTNLESTNTQAAITELNTKINNIDLNNDNNNIITVLLSEIKNTNDGIFFIFSNLNSLIGILNNVSATNVNLGRYIISLDIIHPTFVIKYICLITYQNNSGDGVLHLFTPNNTEIITVTTSTITWKTADSRTVNIPISAIDADGKYIYYIS